MYTDFNSEESPTMCGRRISYLYRKSGTYFTMELKKLGLSPTQSIILIGIYRHEGVNQCTLGEIISVLPSVASRVLRELEDKGYITRERDEQNRRNYNLYLTPRGRELAEQSLLVQGRYWDTLLEEFTPEEADTLNHLLARMERRAYRVEPSSELH